MNRRHTDIHLRTQARADVRLCLKTIRRLRPLTRLNMPRLAQLAKEEIRFYQLRALSSRSLAREVQR